MKTLFISVIGLILGASISASASDMPHGNLLELHSCQLYIGGCIASSEMTQDGRYQLRVWTFASGSHRGVEFRGLQIALLEAADQNLAVAGTQPTESMAYLPQSATPVQA